MKEYAPILHPFPRDQHFGEIPPEIDNDPGRCISVRHATGCGFARHFSPTSLTRIIGSPAMCSSTIRGSAIRRMQLLIDGYNLLYASGVNARAKGRTELERARLGLLDFLAVSIDPKDLQHTTIVFDAAGAPPGLPAEVDHAGMNVRFARDHRCADEMIEHLIELCRTPRSLVVVSSDHRLHRAARRRRATVIDSDRWLANLIIARRQRDAPATGEVSKPTGQPTAEEVAHWVARFTEDR